MLGVIRQPDLVAPSIVSASSAGSIVVSVGLCVRLNGRGAGALCAERLGQKIGDRFQTTRADLRARSDRAAENSVFCDRFDAVLPHRLEILVRQRPEMPHFELIGSHAFGADDHHQRRLRDIRVPADRVWIAARRFDRAAPSIDPANRIREGIDIDIATHNLPQSGKHGFKGGEIADMARKQENSFESMRRQTHAAIRADGFERIHAEGNRTRKCEMMC